MFKLIAMGVILGVLMCIAPTAALALTGGDHRYENIGPSLASPQHHQRHSRRHHSRHHVKPVRLAHAHEKKPPRAEERTEVAKAASESPVPSHAESRIGLMPHPEGCPRRAFCGCGTARYLLGKAVKAGGLAIAANWLGFPRAEPGPGMAAARVGHVFAIIKNLGNGKVLAYDPNSGHHQTRIHVRSLRGYTVVNPHGSSRLATL